MSAVVPCTADSSVKEYIDECLELSSEEQENKLHGFLFLGTLRSAVYVVLVFSIS